MVSLLQRSGQKASGFKQGMNGPLTGLTSCCHIACELRLSPWGIMAWGYDPEKLPASAGGDVTYRNRLESPGLEPGDAWPSPHADFFAQREHAARAPCHL